jgi:hypothetical protein
LPYRSPSPQASRFVARQISRIGDVRLDVRCIYKCNPFGSSAVANPCHDDISERCRNSGGRSVSDLEGYADRTVIVQFNLGRKRELLITHKMLQFLQERHHLLFQGPLAVFDVCRPLVDVVCSNFGLPVLVQGSDGNLCGKLVSASQAAFSHRSRNRGARVRRLPLCAGNLLHRSI